jgi:hypothetical protein
MFQQSTFEHPAFKYSWISQAYNRKGGFPSDGQVFKESGKFVVRYHHLLDPAHLRGQLLSLDCCETSARNVCKHRLAEESILLVEVQDYLHKAFTTWCDDWGKNVCNSVTKLVMMESLVGGACVRHFALLARATFSPKFQMWCVCKWADEHQSSTGFVHFPFEVCIDESRSLVCPDVSICKVMTSDDFALLVARSSLETVWTAWDMEYHMPLRGHLLSMIVTGKKVALPLERVRLPKRASNVELRELRAMENLNVGYALPSRAKGPRVGGGRPSASSGDGRRHGRLDVLAPNNPLIVAVDEVPEAGLFDFPLSDALDIVGEYFAGDPLNGSDFAGGPQEECQEEEDAEEHGPHFDVADSVVPFDEDAVDQEVGSLGQEQEQEFDAPVFGPISPHALIHGPSALGYFKDASTDRHLARLTDVWKGSVAIKCYQHPGKCTLAIAEWKLPSSGQLKAWILNADLLRPDASRVQKDSATQVHLDSLRLLRDGAALPGRTRQGLISDANLVP